MCSPTFAAMAITAYSNYQQGRHNAGVERYNARVAENDAEKAREAGTAKEMDHRERVKQILSQQRAQLGASGVALESGSALNLQESTEFRGEVDALRIRSTTEDQAEAFQSEATLARSRARAARRAASMGVASSAAKMGSRWNSEQDGGQAYSDKWYQSYTDTTTTNR